MIQTLTDDQLVSLLQQKNEDAFRILIQRYQGTVYRTAYALTLNKHESEDIVQEVFLKIFEYIGDFRKESQLSTWIHRITVNHCLNWKRKWKRRFMQFHTSLEDNSEDDGFKRELAAGDTPETQYQQKEIEKVVQDALKKLPEDARAVFLLKEMDGLSYDDIASVLKIKRGTVSSRLHYARQRMKQFLHNQVMEY